MIPPSVDRRKNLQRAGVSDEAVPLAPDNVARSARNGPGDGRGGSDLASLARRQVPFRRGERGVLLQKTRLDEQVVCVAGQPDQSSGIVIGECQIGRIDDTLSWTGYHCTASNSLPEFEGHPRARRHRVSLSAPDRSSCFALVSHGPTESPSFSRLALCTLTRSFSWKARASDGVPVTGHRTERLSAKRKRPFHHAPPTSECRRPSRGGIRPFKTHP
jgi:hypothetical protein